MRTGFPDAGDDSASTSHRRAYDLLTASFGPGVNGPLLLVVDLRSPGAAAGDLAALSRRNRRRPRHRRSAQMIGLGLATAVLLDATVVRLILVPAAMTLIGPANWWLPGWLHRYLPRLRSSAAPSTPARSTSAAR